MRAREAKRYKSTLEAKRSELMAAFRHREDIVIERSADEMDNLQLASQRELAISHLDMEFPVLKSVVAALSRIEDCSYGICRECEEPIAPKRLQAVPWAAYCRSCQEAVDRGEGDGVDVLAVVAEGHVVLAEADGVLARGDAVEGLEV